MIADPKAAGRIVPMLPILLFFGALVVSEKYPANGF